MIKFIDLGGKCAFFDSKYHRFYERVIGGNVFYNIVEVLEHQFKTELLKALPVNYFSIMPKEEIDLYLKDAELTLEEDGWWVSYKYGTQYFGHVSESVARECAAFEIYLQSKGVDPKYLGIIIQGFLLYLKE